MREGGEENMSPVYLFKAFGHKHDQEIVELDNVVDVPGLPGMLCCLSRATEIVRSGHWIRNLLQYDC